MVNSTQRGDPMSSEYDLIIPFTDGSESFVLGFESGIVYHQLVLGIPLSDFLGHTKNKEQFELFATHFNLHLIATPAEGDESGEWMIYSFIYKDTVVKPATKLRIVE